MKFQTQTTISSRLRRAGRNSLLAAGVALALNGLPMAFDAMVPGLFSTQVQAAEAERRPPPEARQSETLSRRVYERIEKVMELRDAEDFAGARAELGEIRALFDQGRLNNREKQVMFQFYANLDQLEENFESALQNYIEINKLPNLTQTDREQTLTQIGSLYFMLERYQEAIDTFRELLAISLEPDAQVYLRIAFAYYSLEQYANVVEPLQTHMDMLRAAGQEIPYNTYNLMKSVYLLMEDYAKSYQAIREMIVLYHDEDDWVQLVQAAGALEQFDQQARLYYVSYIGGFLKAESDFRNLASILSNFDNPYGCGKTMEKSLADGVVEATEDNLFLTGTCFRLAREDARAIPFMERAADLSDTGDKYFTLGVTHMVLADWQKAVDAFTKAIEKGGLNNPGMVSIQQARAYMEMNRYDEALSSARAASRDREMADQAQTWITILGREKERYETIERQKRELAEFYR